MKQRATVVQKDGKLVACVVRPEACMHCRACDYGQHEESYLPLPPGRYTVGDEVDIVLGRGRLTKASLLAYGIPLLGLLAALFLSSLFPISELWQAAAAAGGALVGFGILRLLDPRLRKYAPVAYLCGEKEEIS